MASDLHLGRKTSTPLRSGRVLKQEFSFIHGQDVWNKSLEAEGAQSFVRNASAGLSSEQEGEARLHAEHAWATRTLPGAGQAALCLSGGGIRSAAFGLGVLQGLAQRKLLEQFHYLSTVSGGGYIGAWLTAWRVRDLGKLASVLERLSKRGFEQSQEPEPLQRLRFNQNFLTPRVGLGSADIWTAVAAFLRNLLLNWVVFLPLLCSLLLLPRIIEAFVLMLEATSDGYSSLFVLFNRYWPANLNHPLPSLDHLPWYSWLDSAAAALVLLASVISVTFRPAGGRKGLDSHRFNLLVMAPLVLSSLLISASLSCWLRRDNYLSRWTVLTMSVYVAARLLAVLFFRFRERTGSAEAVPQEPNPVAAFLLEIIGWAVAGALTGLVIGAGAEWARAHMLTGTDEIFMSVPLERRLAFGSLLTVFGPPWVLLAFLLGDAAYVGVTSRLLYAEQDREWLAHAAGRLGAIAVGYLVFTGTVVYGWGLIELGGPWLAYAATGTGLISIGGALTPLTRATAAAAAREHLPITNIISAASCLFLLAAGAWLADRSLAVLIVLSGMIPPAGLMTDIFAGCFPLPPPDFDIPTACVRTPAPAIWQPALLVACLAAVLFGASMLLSSFVNVNWFSLHAMYRNRLTRTFLGASNVQSDRQMEQRDPLDGFSLKDNLAMAELRAGIADRFPDRPPHHDPEGLERRARRLFPVLNMSLNVLATKNLAWQERKAEPFVATPLHVGGDRVGYRDSAATMAGGIVDSKELTRGITLGTAMAISGAAISPNWGYHSSPITSFLMMLANIRLGWWIGNPSHRNTWRSRGPSSSWRLLLQEALGQTDDEEPWLYVSDGGHFENLGLYEMVRRRCRTIVVSDAGADPKCALEDLGNAVRKIWIDLGVRIEFDRILVRKRGDVATTGVYCALGRIFYPEYAGSEPDHGRVLYIKPGFYGTEEPADVRAYAAANAKFPHESTLDQWFGESQFESYRSLGAFVIEALCKPANGVHWPVADVGAPLSLEGFFKGAQTKLETYKSELGTNVVEIRTPVEIKMAAGL